MSVIVIGHKNPDTDSLISAIAAADLYSRRGIDAIPAAQGKPSPETAFVLETFALSAPQIVTDASDQEVYLVDFSDLAQAPEGMASATIRGIIDHHKLGDVTTDSPVEAWIWPVGSTATVIKNIFDYHNIQISRNIAGGLMSAILSDTVLFKSPTCADPDKKAVEELSQIAQIQNPLEYGMEMFRVKSAVEGASANELVFRDYKDFDMNGKKIGIGQLEVIDLALLDNIKNELREELKKIRQDGRHSVFLLLTDIMKEGSELLIESDEPEIVEKAFNVSCNGDKIWLPGVMSRKKQVVPNFQKILK